MSENGQQLYAEINSEMLKATSDRQRGNFGKLNFFLTSEILDSFTLKRTFIVIFCYILFPDDLFIRQCILALRFDK